ncbi:MAG: tetratricopeptide repeat protein, partial [Dehalococcoidia bacterium]
VARLLEGTVRHAGDVVRITASLVNAADGSTLWAQRYDRPFEDLFALQDEITKAVAAAMQTELLTMPGAVVQSDRPPSGNLAAYTAIQHGNAYYALGTEAGYRRAIDAANEAIALDPRYATAFASLAYAWTALAAEFLNGQEATRAYATARTAIDTALDLDPNSSRAHWVHAYLLATADMNWTGAEGEYRAALRLAPNDASMKFRLAGMSATSGHVKEAIGLAREALVANPRAASWYYWLATYLSAAGRLDEAREAIDTAIELQPGANGYRQQLAIIEILQGNADAALKAARQEPPGGWHDAAVTLALQIGPDRTVADGALKDFTASYARNGAWQIAEVHALRGDVDATFEWLDRAWKNRDSGIQYLLYDPFVLRHRSDPRFAAFCAKVGLTATTDAVAMN